MMALRVMTENLYIAVIDMEVFCHGAKAWLDTQSAASRRQPSTSGARPAHGPDTHRTSMTRPATSAFAGCALLLSAEEHAIRGVGGFLDVRVVQLVQVLQEVRTLGPRYLDTSQHPSVV